MQGVFFLSGLLAYSPVRGAFSERTGQFQATTHAVRTLERSFQNFFKEFKDQQRDPEMTADLKSLINIGRFRREHLDADSALGFTGSKARIVYGDMVPEGNMEGSLYTIFGDDTLRIRWEGKNYIQVFMNGGHTNRFDITPQKDGTFEAKIMYLGGQLPFKHDEGVSGWTTQSTTTGAG